MRPTVKVRLKAASRNRLSHPRIAGLGSFSSGKPDLGANKKYLQRFGRSNRSSSKPA
jgi:hypothetical protein